MIKIGAHVSVAGGLHNAISKGQAIGAEVLQIFVSGPQSFRVTAYSDEAIEEFKKLYQSAGFSGLFLHAIYLINLASSNERSVALSIESLVHYMQMGAKLGAVGTIVHLGSFNNAKKNPSVIAIRPPLARREKQSLFTTSDVGIATPSARNDDINRFEKMISAIKEILSKTPASQKLIVENAAGSKIGKDLDELVRIHEVVGSTRLTFCIDTQHLFASGIDVTDREIFGKWLAEFDKRIGIDHLSCIHANDSKTELGSGADRHENIGMGLIGEKGFRNILSQPLLQNNSFGKLRTMPFILEVPGTDRNGPDRENIERLRSLR